MSLALLLAGELRADRAAGHVVFGISAPGVYENQISATGATHIAVPHLTRQWRPTSDLRAALELWHVLRRLKLDVLHTHTPKAGVLGRIIGRAAGVPVIVNTCHGLRAGPDHPIWSRALVHAAEGLAALFSDAELFQNATDRLALAPLLGRKLTAVVGNGVDLERFGADTQARRRIRNELALAEDEQLVLAVGRRVREKGLTEFSAMARRLSGRAQFVWVGGRDDTDPDAETLDVDEVRWLGERADMPAVYAAADLFVLPTYREGFSRSGMEAAATGLPMVLTDIRGCREIGTRGEHLLLVEPRDAAALTDAVTQLLDDSQLRDRLGRNARARALATFDQQVVAQHSLETYAEVARRKNLPWATPRARTRVLHVLPQDLRRGAQTYAAQLRDAMIGNPRQHHVILALFEHEPANLRPDVTLPVAGGLARGAGLDPRVVVHLRELLLRNPADVIVAHGGESLKYVVAARPSGRIVYYRLGLSTAELARPSRLALYRQLMRRTDHVVGVSTAINRHTHEMLGVSEERLSLIPNARHPGVYYPGDSLPSGPPLVLFIGQLEPGKRPELFLTVVADLRGRGLPMRAAIVGDGPLRPALAQAAAELDISLLGTRHDVPDLLRTAAIVVMTSATDTEGMPGVLIEAGLTGIPVVTTAAAGAGDVVADGVTGYVVSDDNPHTLATRVAALIGDPVLRQAMGGAARERCLESFTFEATARQWGTLIDRLGDGHHERGAPAARTYTHLHQPRDA